MLGKDNISGKRFVSYLNSMPALYFGHVFNVWHTPVPKSWSGRFEL